MQTIRGVQEFPIRGNQDLRRKARSSESGGQGGDGLLRTERAGLVVKVEESDHGGFFLKTIEPPSIGMEDEMARTVAGSKRNERCPLYRGQLPVLGVEAID